MIILENASKTYAGSGRAVRALVGIHLRVQSGEWLAVMGPSGAGKTTLLRVIAGLEPVDSGRVSIELCEGSGPAGVGMLFQDHPLFPHLTVRGNLEFALRRRRIAPAERGERVAEVADILRIQPLLGRMPNALSEGERRRVALGSVLAYRPHILLLDEPFGSLDELLRLELREELHGLRRGLAGTTVVVVTHDPLEAMALGDRVALIESGELRQVGPPAELYHRPAHMSVASATGRMPLNRLEGECVSEGGRVFLQVPGGFRMRVPSSVPVGPVVLGVRGHDLLVEAAGSRPCAAGDESAAGMMVTGLVEGVEFAGHERVLRLRVGGARWLACGRADSHPAIGTAVAVHASWDSVHWFDVVAGWRVES